MTDPTPLYAEAERLLNKYTLPEQNREGRYKGRRNTFGVVCCLLKHTRPPKPANNNRHYPELFEALRALGDAIVPFTYDAITINQNTVIPKHKDKGNLGASLLITMGNYTGGRFMLGEEPQDTLYNPIVFNGDEVEHYGEPFEGTRFSVIYFKITIPTKFLSLFPEGVNDPNRDYSLMDLLDF